MLTTMPRRKPKPMAAGKLPKEVDKLRLSSAIEDARRVLKTFREERLQAVKEFAGWHYSDGGTDRPVPVNVISLFVNVMSSALINKTPKVMLSTTDPKMRPAVQACEDWANDEAETMYLADTLGRIGTDALFSIGIAMVGICDPGQAATKGWAYKSGRPCVERVDLDDFVFDVFARDFREVSFIGHRYRVPITVANAMYRADLEPDEVTDTNADGDDRIGTVGRGSETADEFEEHVTLWQIYLPRHRLIVTLEDDPATGADEAKDIVRVQKWIGPECGPYHILALGTVPGSPMPKGLVMDLIDLHRAINRCYRKLIEQCDRAKSVLPVRGGDSDDAGRLIGARDGEAFRCDNPADLKEISFGGPSQGVFLMVQHLKELFSWLAGNLDVIGGLSPQAKTLGQEQILAAGSSRTVSDKQVIFIEWASSIYRALTWYWWNHPEKVMETEWVSPADDSLRQMRRIYPKGATNDRGQSYFLRRDGKTPKVQVDPYSFSHQTPQQRLAFISGFVDHMRPMMQLLAQQGVIFDAQKYVELTAKYGHEPDLNLVFTVREPVPPRAGGDGGGDQPGMPANTSREYIRRSIGGDSQAAKGAEITSQMEAGSGMNGQMGA